MKKTNIFKRFSALALAIAIIALGTGCGNKETDITTKDPVSTTDNNKVKLEDIKDVKPKYEEGVISEKEIQVSTKLNEVIKSMINEDKYYAKNFDYYVERLTITDVKIEALENAVMRDYAGVDYAPSAEKSKVTISYVADAVNKQTGDKTTEANSISYVVNSAEVANIANLEPEEVEFETMAQAVANSTEEKLAEVEQGQNEEEDKVEGRQSNVTGKFSQYFITNEMLAYYYNLDVIKNYIVEGYTLISDTSNCGYEEYRNKTCVFAMVDDKQIGEQFRFVTPNGMVTIVDGKELLGTYYSISFTINTLAINENTGDKRLIVSDFYLGGTFTLEEYNKLREIAMANKYFDPYQACEQVQPNMLGIKEWVGIICGSEPFTDSLYRQLHELYISNPYEFSNCDYFDTNTKIENIMNYQDKIKVMTLADENNNNVYIKEPTK